MAWEREITLLDHRPRLRSDGDGSSGDRPSCDPGRMGAGIEGRQSEHRKERVQGVLKKGGIRGVHYCSSAESRPGEAGSGLM